jgi:hypothetical protein
MTETGFQSSAETTAPAGEVGPFDGDQPVVVPVAEAIGDTPPAADDWEDAAPAAQTVEAGTQQYVSVQDTPDAGISTEAPEVTDGTQAPEEAAEEADTPKAERRPRGWLASDVKQVCDKFITGEIVLPEGKMLTPHRVASLVKELDNLEKAPSAGAVSAVFNRWEEYGFVRMNAKPYAFADYTDEGRNVGLNGLIEARQAQRKTERAAAKTTAPEAPAEAAPEASDDPSPS